MKQIIVLLAFMLAAVYGFSQDAGGYEVIGWELLQSKKAFVIGTTNDTLRATTQMSSADTTIVTLEYLQAVPSYSLEKATTEEVIAGVDDTKYATPKGIAIKDSTINFPYVGAYRDAVTEFDIEADSVFANNLVYREDSTTWNGTKYDDRFGNAAYDSIPELRTDINANYDSLGVHLDTLQAHNVRINSNKTNIQENTDSLLAHNLRLIEVEGLDTTGIYHTNRTILDGIDDTWNDDVSPTNELQTISTTGAAGNITLSNGGGTLNLNVNDADSNSTNEVQDLSLSGNVLTLTQDPTTVDISTATAVAANTAKVTNATHSGDATGSTVLTLATVNSNIGTYNNVTINAKGLATAGSNVNYSTDIHSNITALNAVSGTNTGDQDLSQYQQDSDTTTVDGTKYDDRFGNTAYGWGNHAGLYDPTGTASGLIGTHESTYNHLNYNTAYSHSQLITGNPHQVTKTDVGLGNVENAAASTLYEPIFSKNDGFNLEVATTEEVIAGVANDKIITPYLRAIADEFLTKRDTTDAHLIGTINGVNDTFTTYETFYIGSPQLWVNGVKQEKGLHYNVFSLTAIKFEPGFIPGTGEKLSINYKH